MQHRVLIFSAALAVAACTLAPPHEPSAPTAPVIAPMWSTDAVDALIGLSHSAQAEGLPSYENAAAEIAGLQERATTNADRAVAFDRAADRLFVALAQTFAQGAVDPTRADPQWRISRPSPPDVSSLLVAARADATAVRALSALLPQTHEYATLRAELRRVLAEPPGTLDASGHVREARVASLRASLERWRWLPRESPSPRIEVHIAQAQVLLLQTSTPPRTHNAIVGALGTQTPSFASEINAVTLNPTWTPPSSILNAELLPQFARDPSAASRGGYDAFDATGAIVDPTAIDWAARPFPYSVRQRPGALNALGRVKFEMPNPFGIYLHDTPNHALFAQERRALSHGCVRVDDALDLAAAVLAPAYSTSSLQEVVDGGRTQSLPLAAPIPVYVLYITASSANGSVVYAEDFYRRDAAVVAALDAPASYAAAKSFTPPVGGCASAR